MVSTLTQKWLRQNVHSYPGRDRVYADANAVLSRFPTIRPKTDVYTFDDGRTQLLLCLHGLLPITFRQASYNIPIAIWITHDFPRRPPLVYVVPTSEMLVKAGKYMDVSGKCNITYIQNWERKSEACNLLSLMEEMQDEFSREPPVYAKSKQSESRTPVTPGSPVRDASQRHSHRPTVRYSDDHRPPPIPPKPGASFPDPQSRPASVPWPGQHELAPPQRAMSVSSTLSCVITNPHKHRLQPVVPPRPPPTPGMFVPSPQHQRSMSIHSTNPSGSTMYQPPINPMSPVSSPSSQRWSLPPSQVSTYAQNTDQGSQAHPIPLAMSPLPPQVSPSFVAPNVVTPSYSPLPPPQPEPRPPPPNLLEEPAVELGDAVPAPSHAPPRPMNPELLRLHADVHAKFSSELASLSQAMALDAERLRAHQRDLLVGEPAIRDEMARLEAVKDVCRGVAGRLRTVVGQAEMNLGELKKKGDPEVDELVCSTTIVHNQLINLVAEENAIEDTIYHLHRALNTGRIDLDRFLRTTRVLAEEQFMKKALIEKIQTGLPMSQWA
ncbi:UEV-domain-containing protein [Gloeophyllum trabeum ATCC 11539]|uniref:UEV-domain-containing protein n=1 Tax=Gloeophyllum trabeum (strain ATCC 11539 / FP-39264 / Madison 617) TaxID=670483 RepID=S7RTX8_GLOTA|nr:UEV-domain-containing protein [Gloeophyllum trabeum ATCC 11539]EPQ58155.1 UEV-domain-containing protein [Gloeophyllum trabeum ATCC 11539]